MQQSEVFEKVVSIISPYVKDQAALATLGPQTSILEDLKVNSARLVDVVLAFEDEFGIQVADDEVDAVATVGDAVELIVRKLN